MKFLLSLFTDYGLFLAASWDLKNRIYDTKSSLLSEKIWDPAVMFWIDEMFFGLVADDIERTIIEGPFMLLIFIKNFKLFT